MRIVSGKWRGRQILVPDTPDTRPTMDRTREAVFNILRSASWAMGSDGAPLLNGAKILDVFAGSGAMGFEALSQGADEAVFFEMNKPAIDVLQKNIAKMQANAVIVQGNAVAAPENKKAAAHIVFLDPPYDQDLILPTVRALADKKWITSGTLLVIETRKTEELKDVAVLDTRLYGMAKMTFAKFS